MDINHNKKIRIFIKFNIIIMILSIGNNVLQYFLFHFTIVHGNIGEIIALFTMFFIFPYFYLYYPVVECIFGIIILVMLLDKDELHFDLRKEYLFFLPFILFAVYAIYFIMNNSKFIINIILACIAMVIWVKVLFCIDKSKNKMYLKSYSIISFSYYVSIYWLLLKYVYFYLDIK
jgi:hypothetical protein